jgi:hypothetical protein
MCYCQYVNTLLHHFENHQQKDGLMINLIDQLWLSLDGNGAAIIPYGAFK